MGERRTEVIDEKYFKPIFREDGLFPPAPPAAVLEYRRLQGEWLMTYPRQKGVEPRVVIYPRKDNCNNTVYVVAKEIEITK